MYDHAFFSFIFRFSVLSHNLLPKLGNDYIAIIFFPAASIVQKTIKSGRLNAFQ